jgi:hypothetical protein
MTNKFTCPCCGYKGLETPPYEIVFSPASAAALTPPYGNYFGTPSYDVCDCCGFEYGNDDEPGTGVAQSFPSYLAEWNSNGQRWFDPSKKPTEWDLQTQLRVAGIIR